MGRPTDIVLYQAEWCPYCARVRAKLTDLLLDYKVVNVPRSHAERDIVREVSGHFVDAIDESIKTRPYTTLAIVAGIAFLFGATWRR